MDSASPESTTVHVTLVLSLHDLEHVRCTRLLRAWLGAVVQFDLEILIRHPIERGLADDHSVRVRSARAGADHERVEGCRLDVVTGHVVEVAHVARRARIPALELHAPAEGGLPAGDVNEAPETHCARGGGHDVGDLCDEGVAWANKGRGRGRCAGV